MITTDDNEEVREVIAVLVTLALGLVLSLALIAFAYAHDERITQHKSPGGTDCCGPGACKQVSAVPVTLPAPGYRIADGTFIDASQALPSDDSTFWLCRHGNLVTCFFVPSQRWGF